jgi:uncharacterized protein
VTKEDIVNLTNEYGGRWAIEHTKRLIHSVSTLGEGLEYDREAIWVAAHLHDWGGYTWWHTPGVEHQFRSAEVARETLRDYDCTDEFRDLVLEIIQFHHGGGEPDRSLESRLFTDADALDLLGVVGICRVFAMNARDIKAGYDAAKRWRDMSLAAVSTEKGKQLVEKRLYETNALLAAFEEETFGMF